MHAQHKILIVDDEVDLIELVSFQFKAKGFDVQTASDGIQALERLAKFTPDLIILDMNMPRMGGIELYSKMCDANGKPRYPILVLTARSNIKELFKDLFVDGFMVKPFEIDQLVLEAEAIIKRSNEAMAKSGSRFAKNNKKICIVEDDPKTFGSVTGAFLTAGYTVIPADKGAVAIEKITEDVPDVALVKLGLPDFPGDMVILRLSQMSKTMGVKYVLFSPKGFDRNNEIAKRLGGKSGILAFVEYLDPKELLEKVRSLG